MYRGVGPGYQSPARAVRPTTESSQVTQLISFSGAPLSSGLSLILSTHKAAHQHRREKFGKLTDTRSEVQLMTTTDGKLEQQGKFTNEAVQPGPAVFSDVF